MQGLGKLKGVADHLHHQQLLLLVGDVVFIDFLQLMNAWLEKLVANLAKERSRDGQFRLLKG